MKVIEFRLRNFAFNLGLSISISLFLFQTAKSWIDEGTHGALVSWLFPLVILLSANMLYFYIYFVLLSKKHDIQEAQDDPYKEFVDGVISYARKLYADKRDPALLRLRNKRRNKGQPLTCDIERRNKGQPLTCDIVV